MSRNLAVDADDEVRVRVHARIVPNGATEGGRLRATVLLTPVLESGAEGISLAQWPKAVYEWLAARQATLDGQPVFELDGLILAMSGQMSRCLADAPHSTVPLFAERLPRIAEMVPQIGTMWNRSLWGDKTGKWLSLGKQIARSLSGELVSTSQVPKTEYSERAPVPEVYGADGQLAPAVDQRQAPQAQSVETALQIRHADIALTLEHRRAEALKRSLARACGMDAPPREATPIGLGVCSPKILESLKVADPAPLKDKDDNKSNLLRAIAATSPCGGQDFDAYLGGLVAWVKGKGGTISLEAARELTQRDEDVLAKLRRNRKIFERCALFEGLEDERERARKDWAAAASDLDGESVGACTAPSWTDSAVTHSTLAKGGADFGNLTRAARYANWPQYRTQKDDTPRSFPVDRACILDPEVEDAARTFYTIQSTPSLARAFLLAIDVTIDATTVASALGSSPFGHISFAAGANAATCQPRPWTLFRFGQAEPLFFWPATRGEAGCHVGGVAKRNSTRQWNGLMVMGFGASARPADHVPRFDVTSLDVRTAMEMELQRAANEAADMTAGSPNSEALPPPHDEDRHDEGDRQDVGLTLLDRGLGFEAIRKMVARAEMTRVDSSAAAVCSDGERPAVILDAEDLTTGYRLFVGTPEKKKRGTRWRPLMSRSITFGTTGPDVALNRSIESVLSALIGRAGSPERIALESAMMTVPGRMLPKEREPSGGGLRTEAIFEQVVSVWDAGPMGVDCSERPGPQDIAGDTLIFGRTLGLPTSGELRPPRARIGRAYRFAMAATYSGGHSVPQTHFPDDAGGTKAPQSPLADLYYPSAGMVQEASMAAGEDANQNLAAFVRALRHAKIGAPHTLMPQGHALRMNGPMGPEQAGLMVIRSVDGTDDSKLRARATPRVSQRLVLVPSIPQARAAVQSGSPDAGAAEGVFDAPRFLRAGPPVGAYPNVRQTDGAANFPAVKTRFLTGFNGRQHVDVRELVADPSAADLSQGEVLAGSVFAGRQARTSRYYPDPAADNLAVRVTLKSPGSEECRYSTELVDLVDGRTYPDRTPVLLSLRPLADARTTTPAACGDLVTQKDVTFDPSLSGDIARGRGFAARELEIQLAPHEWVEIELWFVPSALRLARDFAVIQALAVSMTQSAHDGLVCSEADFFKACEEHLPMLVKPLRAAMSADVGRTAFFGPGGVAVPAMRTLLALGRVVHDCMKTHPIPEISAVARVQAVHSMNRATTPPVIVGGPPIHFDGGTDGDGAGLRPLRAYRPPPSRPAPAAQPAPVSEAAHGESAPIPPDPAPAMQAKPVPTAQTDCHGPGEPQVAAPGSTELVLTGDVELDLNQIDTIEVLAKMPFPGTSGFDDRLRGRSLAQRRANFWPLNDKPAGVLPEQANPDSFLPSDKLFGFSVAPNGSVTLPSNEVVLLRAERLPRPVAGEARVRLPLRCLFERPPEGVRVTERHVFADGKARRMQVRVNALPRTGEFMRTADRRLVQGDPWIGFKGLQAGDLADAEAPLALEQKKQSAPVEVVLPATIRPAKPNAPAPEPALYTAPDPHALRSQGRLVVRRASTIRIRLGREWFSSGEDERLGIVLWPPNLTNADSRLIARNLATLRPGNGERDRRIYLNATGDTLPFEDDFLGYGGRFVSRRGADPVREGVPHRQILFAPWDLPDLHRPESDPRRPELVGRVDMPLSDEGGPEHDKNRLPPMQVALLTYQPRFDVEAEEWFVEVDLRDSDTAEMFVRFGLVRYQPHTTPALRCSRPVAQYVVPLPARMAEVARRPEGDGLRIRMTGPTFSCRRFSTALAKALADEASAAPPTAEAISDGNVAAGPETTKGRDAAPWMMISFQRQGRDAAGRSYAETAPLPTPHLGRDAKLLLPLDFDMAVVDGLTPISSASGPMLAASVSVKAREVRGGEGLWWIDVLDDALTEDGAFNGLRGLSLTIREVIADEPATPPTHEDVARIPTPSLATAIEAPEAPSDCAPPAGGAATTAPPGALAPGYHLGGARFEATFDLSLLALPPSNSGRA